MASKIDYLQKNKEKEITRVSTWPQTCGQMSRANGRYIDKANILWLLSLVIPQISTEFRKTETPSLTLSQSPNILKFQVCFSTGVCAYF
ncbi:hypothetical protein AB3S75_016634 [Citrus x aurantiifolia]